MLLRKNHFSSLLLTFFLSALLIYSLSSPVFASATDDIEQFGQAVGEGTVQLWNILKAVVGPLAGVVFAYCGIKLMFGGERGIEEAKKRMLIIIVVIMIVYGAGVIVGQVQGWFDGSLETVNISIS